ncbi:MAG: Modification methylase MboII [Nitrospira sp.]|nr:Modification methylase MboII [Nitrospira sp.]
MSFDDFAKSRRISRQVSRDQLLIIHGRGDCRELLPRIEPESVSLSVWSPPYWVGKSYETNLSFEDWQGLLSQTIRLHYDILKPGGFLAINIADILCFRDPDMPRIQLPNVSKHRSPITRDMVLEAVAKHPEYNRNQLAELLGCSEQTIDRRMHGNNIRGGKYGTQTRVKLVGGLVEQWATDAGLYLYDRRIWVKDPAWANGQWHSSSYRSVDEFEYIYVFWKPGETVIDRQRIEPKEWSKWGSRGVWTFRSVRANDEHEAKYPLELPLRLIRLLTEPSDTVLDCFMGSGTTALAAIQSDRNFIGCEMMPGYLELAKKNIAQLRLNGIQGTLTLACDHLEEPTP